MQGDMYCLSKGIPFHTTSALKSFGNQAWEADSDDIEY